MRKVRILTSQILHDDNPTSSFTSNCVPQATHIISSLKDMLFGGFNGAFIRVSWCSYGAFISASVLSQYEELFL